MNDEIRAAIGRLEAAVASVSVLRGIAVERRDRAEVSDEEIADGLVTGAELVRVARTDLLLLLSDSGEVARRVG